MRWMPFLAGLLVGGGVVGATWLTSGDARLPSPDAGSPDGASRARDDAALVERLDRIERLVEEIARRPAPTEGLSPGNGPMTSLLASPEEPALGSAPAGAPAARGAEPNVELTEEAVAAGLARFEARRFERMTPAEAQAEAERLLVTQKDGVGAKRVLEALLARSTLSEEERVKALGTLGVTQRALKDYDASERTLRSALVSAGAETPTGRSVAYQLVWTLSEARRDAEAIDLATRLTRPEVEPALRRNALWAIHLLAARQGEALRAAEALDALRREAATSPDAKRLVEDIERRAAGER
jgi:hypothetical protein